MKQLPTMRSQGAFTLLELLVSVAILSILMVLAVPAYQSYTAKAQASEGLQLSASLRSAYEIHAQTEGGYPADLQDAGFASANPDDYAGKYVAGMTMSSGIIAVTYSPTLAATPLAGTQLTFTPYENGSGAIIWRCGNGPEPMSPDGVTPLSVFGTADGSPVATTTPSTTPDAVLPADCRA